MARHSTRRSSSTSKFLVIVRHAHRDTSHGRERDNGLSKKGWNQTFEMTAELVAWLDGRTFTLFSSPKVRCRETVEPLSALTRHRIRVTGSLDECGARESADAFRTRVRALVRRWKRSRVHVWIFCTHGDVVPVLAEACTGRPTELKKGEWIFVELP